MTSESTLIDTPSPRQGAEHGMTDSPPRRRGRIGWVVAGLMTTGLVAALLFVVMPIGPATQSAVTGSVPCGLAVGWTRLAVLSLQFTDQPQRWAFAPASVMGVGGVLLLLFGSSAQLVLNWAWPPVMLALAIWMIVRIRRELRGSRARWLLYPVIV